MRLGLGLRRRFRVRVRVDKTTRQDIDKTPMLGLRLELTSVCFMSSLDIVVKTKNNMRSR